MTPEDIELLSHGPVRDAVEENIGRDPLRIALDKRLEHAALVASQVKYLQRARAKLPSYYAARCVIPPLAFEQSSSERTAAHKEYSGELCIDLTCGLGVDSYYLSKRFDRVIALEKDPVLAEIARVNFRLLGADNIEVVNCPAEQFFVENKNMRAGLIYADPDRRDESGRKMVVLRDCSPDVVAMIPVLKAAAAKVVVKLSPMFDVDEVFRVFGRHTKVDVVSLDGECKEVLAESDDAIPVPFVRASVLGAGSVEYPFESGWLPEPCPAEGLASFRYLIVPDVALAKARIAVRYFTGNGVYMENDNSFAFSSELPENILGKAYEVQAVQEYSPKKLKKELKAEGVKRLNILKRDFPYTAPEIAGQLSVTEGGSRFMAFTRHAGKLWALFLKPI